jgi:integrase
VAKSTKKRSTEKPKKPHTDYPLFPHATRRWAKKVRGKLEYFGPWEDPDGALNNWLDQKDDLLAGRKPRAKSNDPQVRDAANHFLTHKEDLVQSGELSPLTFDRYKRTCAVVVEAFGRNRLIADLGPLDFQELRKRLSKNNGPVALGNEIQIVRSLFKFAYEVDLIDRPVKFGPAFKKPSAKTLRQNRAAKGDRSLKSAEVRAMLDTATPNMKAMILLGLNAGLGNTDVALLEPRHIDDGWLTYPRPKTGTMRRAPLWPETIEALSQLETGLDSRLVFTGRRGVDYIGNCKGYRVTQEFDRVAKKAGVTGHTFYDCRRTFQTIGEGANDLSAVQHIMGHAAGRDDMSATYRQSVDDERLQAVVDHIRDWLFGNSEKR